MRFCDGPVKQKLMMEVLDIRNSVSFCSVRNCTSDLIANLWKSSGINTQ